MADKKISQLTAASQVNSDAVFPLSQIVSGSDATVKATVGQVGDYIADRQTHAGLNTTAKDLIGAINEIAAGGGGGGGTSLANNCLIGITASNKVPSPYNAGNYITVSGTTVTFTRNNNTYHIWFYSPVLLEVGKKYAFTFDELTNADTHFYLERTSDLSTNPVVASRFDDMVHSANTNGFVITPNQTAYYGVAIWSNNTNPIIVKNPMFYELQ